MTIRTTVRSVPSGTTKVLPNELVMINGNLHVGITQLFPTPVSKPTSVTARAALEALGLGVSLISEGVTDGDKGDVTVSSSGTDWRVDQIAGPLNHDGTTVGFYGTTPVTKPTSVTARAALEALGLGATLTSEGVTDGDKGDITVSSSGSVWQVDQIAGPLNHDGTTAGFYGTTPVTKPASVTARAALEALGLAATLIAETITYAAIPAGVPIDNPQASDGSWPARPTSRTDIRVNYIGFPGLTNRPSDGIANLDSYVEKTA